MRKIVLFITTVLLCAPAVAQKQYSLEECINIALQNNTKLKTSENEISSAKEQKKEAFANYIPQVSATAAGFVADKGLVQMNLSPLGIPQTMEMVDDGVLGSVSAMLPLYAGGQIATGNKLAKVGIEVSTLKHNISANEVKLNITQYFWNIVMLKEKLNTLTIVDNQLKTIEQNVNTAVNAGVANRNDLLQVNLKRNELKSSRITVENSIAICRNMLSQSMGFGIDSIDVVCSIAEQMPQSPSYLYTSAHDAVQQTSEYQLLQQNVKAQKLQYKMSVGKNLPTVSVGGMYSYNNLMDKSQNSLIGLATVSIPISNWIGGSHNMKRQKNEVRNAENSLKDNGELLVINIKNKWNALNEAYKQIEISQNSIGQSKENLRLHTDYYNAGTCTMSDLLEAQTMFQQSKDRFVENVTQYEIRKTEYLQSIGR